MLWHVPATLPDSFDTRRADLVQGYDEITAGLTDSRAVFFDLLKGRAPLDRPPLLHTVLLDGQLFGHWRPQPGKGPHRGKIVVELQLYVPPTKKEDAALDDAIARYAAYLGTAVVRA